MEGYYEHCRCCGSKAFCINEVCEECYKEKGEAAYDCNEARNVGTLKHIWDHIVDELKALNDDAYHAITDDPEDIDN